ncbi:hypothetical protein JCM8547_000447 [Rhodosporidiobolus lusitaniae]
MPSITLRTYEDRASSHPIPVARDLLACAARKKTNLCVSVDVTSKAALLRIADASGPYCCCIKTHIDIVEDFDQDLVQQLQKLAEKHDFLIWEDRKFADIGNTVRLQYSSGIYKIASWAHITNAHLVPGEGILTGLASVGQPLGRGLLLLAEMSAKGNLATGEYTQKNVDAARRYPEFVMGFVAMKRVDELEATSGGVAPGEGADYVIMTPGVGLDSKGDGMGQQYRTPDEVVRESGCDIIIVGRGIYGGGEGNPSEEIVEQCKRYQAAGWEAYEQRLKQ